VHLAFATRYRPGSSDGADLRESSGEPDHVHLLAQYPPKVPVTALVNSLKGVSARRLRADHAGRVNRASTHGHFWSPSYLAASCGGAPASITRQYTDQQQRPGLTAGPGPSPPSRTPLVNARSGRLGIVTLLCDMIVAGEGEGAECRWSRGRMTACRR
jgi:hypothetical protein